MNIARIKQLGCLLICFSAIALAALPGDLNGDGRFNVADLVYIRSMVNRAVSPTTEADLNFDGKVDAEDVMLLENALRGNPLPVFLARATVGSAGGSLEHGGFRLDVPAGVLSAPGEIILASINRQMLEDCGVSTSADSTPLMLFGLPTVNGLEFSFQLPATRSGENWSLLLGNYRLPRNAEFPDWHYQLLDQPEDGISIKNDKLVWHPQRIPEQSGTRAGAGTAEGFIFDIERNWLGGTFYTSNHFRLQPLTSTMTDTELNRMQALLQDLENAFSVGIAMGFPENKRVDKWGNSADKIKVVIKKPAKAKFYGLIGENEDAESAWCNPPGYWSPPYLELNTGVVTSPDRREIISHEFFHYLQYYYANNTTTLWLDEMSATWMEGRVSSQGENYCPKTYKNPRAPINGLYRSSSLFSINNAGFHGYSVSAFAYYLSKRYDWPAHFWHTVFSHADYAAGKGMTPLQAGANSISAGGLDYLYLVFLRNYLSDGVSDAPAGKTTFGNNGQRAMAIFKDVDQNECDWKRFPQNGKVSKIEKLSDFSGTLEHDFQVQDMGAVTWLLTFPKPQELIKEGMYARVQVDDVCNNLFAVLFQGPEAIFITQIDNVEHDANKKVRILDIPLAALESADRAMSIGLVAVNTNSSAGDSAVLHPAKMTIQFLGRVILPPERSYNKYYGECIAAATADMDATSDTPGVLGEYRITKQNNEEGHSHGWRHVSVQLYKLYPQTIRIRSNITLEDLGEFTTHLAPIDPTTFHAVPTENAKIIVAAYPPGAYQHPYHTQESIVPLVSLAAEDGYALTLDPPSGQDTPAATALVLVEIKPIYTLHEQCGQFQPTSHEWTVHTINFTFFPPPPANP
ncbi:MAG: hypothetical protein GX927_00775 [Lentisphaerae bacterium]|jgi:hypothetical protein|nr:hypothetical protein [Lentisphaerota bacterium]